MAHSEPKGFDDGGPSGATYKKFWRSLFNETLDCRYYWDGVCVLKVGASEKDFACEGLCDDFEKGKNITKEIRMIRRAMKDVK